MMDIVVDELIIRVNSDDSSNESENSDASDHASSDTSGDISGIELLEELDEADNPPRASTSKEIMKYL